MTDEFHINAGLPVQLFFEGKNDQHLVHEVSDLLDSAFTPCPHLWADVIKNWRAGLLQSLCQPKVEIRKINKNGGRRRVHFDAFGNTAKSENSHEVFRRNTRAFMAEPPQLPQATPAFRSQPVERKFTQDEVFDLQQREIIYSPVEAGV